jgi:HEAT repeat protein
MTDDLRDKVIPQLLAYEPDYSKLAAAGDQLIPLLVELVQGDDARLAERAVVLAFRIGSPAAQELTVRAASDPRSEVRAAVAAKAHLLPGARAAPVLEKLLVDSDASIRRISVGTATRSNLQSLIGQINTIAEADPEIVVREAARQASESLLSKTAR